MIESKKGYRILIAWQRCNMLAHLIYDITANFPKEELFGIISQMRRAALSACANIAEGYSRRGKDRRHFYLMAVASLTELEFFIDFSYERKFLDQKSYTKLVECHTEASKVLSGLLKSTRF